MERDKFDKFHYIINRLREDEVKFKEYFCLIINQFDKLLLIVRKEI